MNGPFQECKRNQSVLHPCRKVEFRKAQRLAKHDGLFVWSKGWYRSEGLSPAQWELLPAQITAPGQVSFTPSYPLQPLCHQALRSDHLRGATRIRWRRDILLDPFTTRMLESSSGA